MRSACNTIIALSAAAAAVLLCGPSAAQSWPTKPVRIIVPFPPGGGLDLYARMVAEKLQESLGQQMIIENRSGASGMIGADAVAKAAPDGYTVLFSTAAEISINQSLYSKISYDPVKDLAPASYASHAALLFSVHPSIPARSIKQLVELAKAKPGQLAYASAGTGSVHHLAGELLKSIARIDIIHVPYKGAGPAVIDMVGGQVAMGFSALPSSLPHARAGKLRALAVTSAKRSEAAGDIPSFVELGYADIDVVSWYGVLAPARTPADIVARLSREVNTATARPEVRARLLQLGIEVIGTTPEQFAKFIQSEIARYAKIIRESGAKLE
jgi:tripartite-type tricarboxylate transporter receptor subunit TctC